MFFVFFWNLLVSQVIKGMPCRNFYLENIIK
uniref:Uncharacterized protein n=1 Tax=Anguilla anguilla TaxID=7936 RepID=A0A0E9PV27_ANGAN